MTDLHSGKLRGLSTGASIVKTLCENYELQIEDNEEHFYDKVVARTQPVGEILCKSHIKIKLMLLYKHSIS